MNYKLIDRLFSRLWRRDKRYSEHELRWLARKRGLTVRLKGGYLDIVQPKSKQVVAHFKGNSDDALPVKSFGRL